MGIEEQPTVKHLQGQVTAFKAMLCNKTLLQGLGLGSKEISDLELKVSQLQQQLSELIDYPRKFNEYFSDDGWLAHESLSFDVLKQAVNVFEKEGKGQAIEDLVKYYGPDQIAKRLLFFKRLFVRICGLFQAPEDGQVREIGRF